MDRTISRLNIEHFRRLLEDNELDEAKRQTILRLLAEEEARYAALSAAAGGDADEIKRKAL